MTCIVGLAHKGVVYIGGDSAGVGEYDLTVRADRKVFRNGDFIMGFTTSFRMGQLLAHAFRPPLHDPALGVEKFMCTTFIDAVRQCLKDGGYARKENENERAGVFLVGYAGRIFAVEADYQVGESVAGYAAVGCGYQIALGSMFSTPTEEPETRVIQALKAAEQFSAGVRGPFHLETIGSELAN